VTARGAVGRLARAEQPAASRSGAGRSGAGRSGAGKPADIDPGEVEPGAIVIRLDEVLAERGMTLTELSELVGITVVNLSVLKNGRARAVRFSTLARLCAVLGCQPGDLLRYEPGSYEPGSDSG
jgi:putative transcriptional regulator